MNTEESRHAAVGLIRRGVAPIPVPAGEKNPGRPGWEALRISEEEVPDHWTNGQNIGALNGEPSGWRVCADLDVPEALGIAGRFLSPTLTSGRESRQHSHWWYIAPGARNRKFKDLGGSVLLELRSTGCQTLVAPSVHPTGEKYVWHSESGLGIAESDSSELEARCAELATATLVARHLPEHRTSGGGGRHGYALALAGFLLRPGRLEQGLLLKTSRPLGMRRAGLRSRSGERRMRILRE